MLQGHGGLTHGPPRALGGRWGAPGAGGYLVKPVAARQHRLVCCAEQLADKQPSPLADWPHERGYLVEGVVVSMKPYGVFIEVDGVVGLLHISQVSSQRVSSLDAIFKLGDRVMPMVRDVDRQSGRVSFSTRVLERSPGDMLTMDPQDVYRRASDLMLNFGAAMDATEHSLSNMLLRLANMEEHERPRVLFKVEEEEEDDVADMMSRLTQQRAVEQTGIPSDWQYQVGDVVDGVVVNMKPYGAFIKFGDVVGLLHMSQITSERISRVDQVFEPGNRVRAMVLHLDKGRGRVTLSTKKLEQEPGDMLRDPQLVYQGAEEIAAAWRAGQSRKAATAAGGKDEEEEEEEEDDEEDGEADMRSGPSKQRAAKQKGIPKDWQYQVGDVVNGVVVDVKPYGALIKVDNAVGMLHISQISHDRVETVDDVFKPGDRVRAMVWRVETDRGRFTLTTKKLEQHPGDMLRDPQLVYQVAEEMAAGFRAKHEM